jgi:hypothetical protein
MSLAARMHAAVAEPSVNRPADARSTRVWLARSLSLVGMIYLLMLNPYWVPSGDGEVYTAIARSLVRGEGLEFNGALAAIAPPGWPVALAGAMAILPEFWFLKLFTITCMLGALGFSYLILVRFVSPRVAAGSIVLGGTLSTVYPLTYFMHSEAFFGLVASAALWLAFRVGERRAGVFETVLMFVLLSAACFTRWPGMFHLALVLPALLCVGVREWRGRRLALAVLACVVAMGTFGTTHTVLSLTPEQAAAARAAGGGSDGDESGDSQRRARRPGNDDQLPPELLNLASFNADSPRGPLAEYAHRVSSGGHWVSWFLAQPARFAQSFRSLHILAGVAGWIGIILLAAAAVSGARENRWFWLGVLGYIAVLVVVWPKPTPRYLVPIAPFVLAGMFVGAAVVSRWLGRAWVGPTISALVTAFVLLTNAPLLAYDIHVFRSGERFYDRFEAGMNRELIDIAHWLHANAPDAGVAVSEKYVNLGRLRYSKYGVRAMHLLLDAPVVGVPRNGRLSRRPNGAVGIWADANEVTYYVFQPPNNPWRVWHFRLPDSIQEKATGAPVGDHSGGWELYVRSGPSFERVTIDRRVDGWPTRVPGL